MMIFDSDKMCSENFHSATANGTLNHFHPRNANGLVDPLSFSAINFLRTYNRLVTPNDIAQCYNLTLLKDSRNTRNIPLPLPPLPIQSILATTPINNTISSPPIATQNLTTNFNENSLHNAAVCQTTDFNINSNSSNIRVQSPPNRTVSSTCPSTPTDASPPAVTIPPLNHHQLSTLTANLSPNFMRRQRGEKRPIPDEQKDEKYYERRKRNNEAAKKSRDARKMREDRVAFRAAMLEQENAILRAQLLAQREEISTLRQLLCTRP